MPYGMSLRIIWTKSSGRVLMPRILSPTTMLFFAGVIWPTVWGSGSRISGTGHQRGALLDCLAHGTLVIEHQPFDNRERQGSVADQLIVKCAEAEICSLPVPIAPQQPHDLPLARDVRDLLRAAGRSAGRRSRTSREIGRAHV